MAFNDYFSMRQRPRGLFKWMLRAPTLIYRARLGWILGHRFILVSHRGRRSGRLYRTPLEVVEHDRAANTYAVCSGTGPRADWYRNLLVEDAPEVQVGNRRWRPGQRLLSDEEAAELFARYETQHPGTAKRLLKTMGRSYDGTDEGRVAMMATMPMIVFSDDRNNTGSPDRTDSTDSTDSPDRTDSNSTDSAGT